MADASSEIDALKALEDELVFPSMSSADAIALGLTGVEVIREKDLNLAVAVVVGGDTRFLAKLKNTGESNDEWLARKAATARHYQAASLRVRLELERDGTEGVETGADGVALAFYGGSFPIRVGGEIVGTFTMSGEQDTVDHDAVVEAMRRHLRR
jgi:uncharacterized protein (UPF0303 family)